jgi:hypothetical protein
LRIALISSGRMETMGGVGVEDGGEEGVRVRS